MDENKDLDQKVDGDQTAGKDESTPKTFTQEDVDRIVNDRLKRANKPKEET